MVMDSGEHQDSGGRNIEPRKLVGSPKTAGYRPSAYASYPGWFTTGWGSFSLGNVDGMRRDPQIALCLGYRLAPIYGAQFQVTADTPEEQDYVDTTLQRFWQRSLPVAGEASAFGYSCSEALYEVRDRRIWFRGLKYLHPKDCRPYTLHGLLHHVVVGNVRDSQTGETRLLSATPNRPCEAFWLTHDPKYNPFYGRSVLMPVWWFWRMKSIEDGVVESIFKWIFKHSISCTVVRHPTQLFDNDTGTPGSVTPAQDLAREMVVNAKAGAVMALPADKDASGDYLWKIEQWAQPTGNAESLIEAADWMDKQIQRGILIPDEILTFDGNAGGYSRSQIAASSFFALCEQDRDHYLETFDEQILRPLVILNFGRATYRIEPLPLLPPDPQTMMMQQQMQQGGQGAPGAQQAGQDQAPPGQIAAPGAQSAPLPWAQPGAPKKQMSLTYKPVSSWGDIVTHEAPHVRLVGSTSSGKTTMARAIAASVDGKIFVIDPVGAPGTWGGIKAATVDENGDYGPIDKAIKGLLHEMRLRGAAMQKGQTQFERLTIIFDEVPDTVAELPNTAGLLIRRIAQRGRHENIHLVAIGQSARVEAWGIGGYGDVAENFVTIFLGTKALDQDPNLAGSDFPGVLEWQGKKYQIDLSSALDVAKQDIPADRQFHLNDEEPPAEPTPYKPPEPPPDGPKKLGDEPEKPKVTVTSSDAKAMSLVNAAIAKVQKLAEERVSPERAAQIAEGVRLMVQHQMEEAKKAASEPAN